MDDDKRILRALALRLEAADYVVRTASNGVSGLETALAEHPDLIVMDICMPFGNGFSVLERLRSLRQDPVPVIFITAYPLPSVERDARDMGAVAYFEKPYDFAQLGLVIERALGGTPPAAAAAAGVPVQHTSAVRPPVVLIVEDDPKITCALAVRLRAAGLIALTAPDGADGLRLAVAHRPDLIVMDIWTPVSTGISAAHHLKEVGLGEIPIIFITASKADALRRQAMEAGAVAFFEKPYDGDALLDTIERTLQHTRTIALAA